MKMTHEWLDRRRRAAQQPRETVCALLRATSATNHEADPRGVGAPGHRGERHAADVALLDRELERRWARDADATRVSLGKYA